MRSLWLALLALFLFSLSSWQVAAEGNLLALRQEPEDTASITVSEESSSTSDRAEPTSSSDNNDNDENGEASGSSSEGERGPTLVSASAIPEATLDANVAELNRTLYNGTMAAPGELPLMPEITPALSVAGVFLMISGVVLCLIGIKNKWIQIFISAAYLTSLAIVVLIIYVMRPPITRAIQGAYLAGVIAPALLLGGGALIFRDVTEGLGCAIGGFSLSMFFLVLRPGGTITSQAGKAIFIGIFTAVAYAFSFSRYTRSYGIIGSTALGGATALVIGIDCFSRAGLKEFWVYIWDLNDELFPLFQNTYPITRGIRVEIAGTVVFTFFGILSQLKIWKVIQARRARKEEERSEANRERDELEAQIGRDVEAGNERDRGQWENIYGDKDKTHADSGIGTDTGSTRKDSTSIYTKESGKQGESIEMYPLESPKLPDIPDYGDSMVIRVGEDDWVAAHAQNERELVEKDAITSVKASSVNDSDIPTPAFPTPALTVPPKDPGPQSPVPRESSPKTILPMTLKPSRPAGPKVIPLPFKIPEPDNEEDEKASNATFNDSEAGEVKRYSQRFSGLRLQRKPSNRSKRASQISVQTSSSVEALVAPSVDSKSERGSIAMSSRSSSGALSFVADERIASEVFEPSNAKGFSLEKESKPEEDVADKVETGDRAQEETKAETILLPLTVAHLEGDKVTKQLNATEAQEGEKDVPEMKAPSAKSEMSSVAASVKELKPHLPKESSKVVMQYRTNEWAKHLSHAETPEVEELKRAEPVMDESATMVNPRALLQTALTAEPKPAPLPPQAQLPKAPKSPKSPKHPVKNLSHSDTPLPARIPSFSLGGSQSPNLSPSASMASLVDPNGSRTSLHSQAHQPQRRAGSAMALRSTSSPLIHSPIDEDSEATFHTPLSNETLLATRSNMLQHKALNGSTGNLLNSMPPSARNTPSPLPFSPYAGPVSSLAPSVGSQASDQLDDDNISLSARRSQLQRSSTSSSAALPSNSGHLVLPTATYTSNRDAPQYDLRRSTTDPAMRRASMLAAWRQSIAQDVNKGRPEEVEVQMKREEMWEHRKREQEEIARRREAEGGWGRSASRNSKRLSKMSGMGGREMNDAHREVLRRMQAGANKKLKETDR